MPKVIRCAVHGDVELRDDEVALLDTPEVQRLRGIKQLGTASLVYPSAVHTRFEHALGTLHMAERIALGLGGGLDPTERRVVRAAALLHDVTHIPFGHTFEDERRIFERHDAPARTLAFLRRGALARALDATGLRDAVEAALTGTPARPIVADIVRGTIGADLLDYLVRDAWFSGLRLSYDERVLRALGAFPAADGAVRLGLRLVKGGERRGDTESEVLHLLRLRYTLCERVYFHHAKVAAGAMVSRAVELAVNAGLTLEDLYQQRDEGLLIELRTRFADVPGVGQLVRRLEERRIYARALTLTREIGDAAQRRLVAAYHLDRAAREALERDVAADVGLEPWEVIVYCPEPRMAGKEADIPVLVEEGAPLRSLADLALPEVSLLVERHRDLWRFYVLVARERVDRRERVAAAARALLAPVLA